MKDRPSRSLLTEASEDHYLALPGARVVATDALQHTKSYIQQVIEKNAMMCVHGNAGTGKTFCVNEALRCLACDRSYRIELRDGPTPTFIREALFSALGVAGKPPQRPAPFDRLLKEVLAEEPRVLVCDEAQRQPKKCFEYWRSLWDDPKTKIAVIFVGGEGCFEVLKNEPMLSSRIFIWQEFCKMEPEQVLNVITDFHPIWSDVDDELILLADNLSGHGNFRNWAKITSHADWLLKHDPEDKVINERLLRKVAGMLGGKKARRAA
ncbi:AAA family ATPase [Nonomuraea sp. H19]|uniref:AAA family ATPase n=1 Tax=Nonomuraea sp. H19 TaxID=3452206 RepID=UPI003F8B302D